MGSNLWRQLSFLPCPIYFKYIFCNELVGAKLPGKEHKYYKRLVMTKTFFATHLPLNYVQPTSPQKSSSVI